VTGFKLFSAAASQVIAEPPAGDQGVSYRAGWSEEGSLVRAMA